MNLIKYVWTNCPSHCMWERSIWTYDSPTSVRHLREPHSYKSLIRQRSLTELRAVQDICPAFDSMTIHLLTTLVRQLKCSLRFHTINKAVRAPYLHDSKCWQSSKIFDCSLYIYDRNHFGLPWSLRFAVICRTLIRIFISVTKTDLCQNTSMTSRSRLRLCMRGLVGHMSWYDWKSNQVRCVSLRSILDQMGRSANECSKPLSV